MLVIEDTLEREACMFEFVFDDLDILFAVFDCVLVVGDEGVCGML